MNSNSKSNNEYKKKLMDVVDFKSLTFWIPLIFSILMVVISIILKQNCLVNDLVSYYLEYLDNIAISLIGFLGFTVTGLAILTGGISNKIYNKLKKDGMNSRVDRIMSSFYLLGAITVVVILVSFLLHFISQIQTRVYYLAFKIMIFVMSFLIAFILTYSVKLIRNCLELLKLLTCIEKICDNNDDYNLLKYYRYKILALEHTLLETNPSVVPKYKKHIKDLIENEQLKTDEKEKLLDLWKKNFED